MRYKECFDETEMKAGLVFVMFRYFVRADVFKEVNLERLLSSDSKDTRSDGVNGSSISEESKDSKMSSMLMGQDKGGDMERPSDVPIIIISSEESMKGKTGQEREQQVISIVKGVLSDQSIKADLQSLSGGDASESNDSEKFRESTEGARTPGVVYTPSVANIAGGSSNESYWTSIIDDDGKVKKVKVNVKVMTIVQDIGDPAGQSKDDKSANGVNGSGEKQEATQGNGDVSTTVSTIGVNGSSKKEKERNDKDKNKEKEKETEKDKEKEKKEKEEKEKEKEKKDKEGKEEKNKDKKNKEENDKDKKEKLKQREDKKKNEKDKKEDDESSDISSIKSIFGFSDKDKDTESKKDGVKEKEENGKDKKDKKEGNDDRKSKKDKEEDKDKAGKKEDKKEKEDDSKDKNGDTKKSKRDSKEDKDEKSPEMNDLFYVLKNMPERVNPNKPGGKLFVEGNFAAVKEEKLKDKKFTFSGYIQAASG
ncbi:hypothetical protein HK407_08g13290 [Ordospora pajunii]|uniref:uncharacterized protein n=1 Tax=Ordospora pajunii TaxID=3039483 RepID=UPI0029526F37|nr:uncharacterized protein HK407_08g13290 [Ordospora pajunii]KAH9411055.1 hypothetical protein HK407_08g13290 [Ordospora pajunii]